MASQHLGKENAQEIEAQNNINCFKPNGSQSNKKYYICNCINDMVNRFTMVWQDKLSFAYTNVDFKTKCLTYLQCINYMCKKSL